MSILHAPMGGEGAGAALAAPPPDVAGAGTPPADATAKTFSVPVDVLPDAKPGDMFKVQSVADGNVMLEHQAAEGGGAEEWGEGLKKAAPRAEEGGMA